MNREFSEKLQQYNRSLSKLTQLERKFVIASEKTNYLYGLQLRIEKFPSTLEELFQKTSRFRGLLQEHSEDLCGYLTHIQEFTCSTSLIRMDVRSTDFSNYQQRVVHAISSFYIFYGAGLSLRELIYGSYGDTFPCQSMAPVIAASLLRGSEEAAACCRDVLTSENNVGFLTQDVIIAIEQSHNRELQDLLTNLLIAAKLQEGVRQSILETVDEYQLDYFLRVLGVIKEENLLRYSSVQRSVLTWIGIGYEKTEARQLNAIFDSICLYLNDETARNAAFLDENPLNVYIALYASGVRNLEQALEEAVQLSENAPRHVTAAALVYLKLTHHFPLMQYLFLLQTHADDPWITALYLSECTQNISTIYRFTAEQCRQLFDAVFPFLSQIKARQTISFKGFDWFNLTLDRESVTDFLSKLLCQAPDRERIEQFLPYVPSLSKWTTEDFLDTCFSYISLPAKKEFLSRMISSQAEFLCEFAADELIKIPLTQEDILALEGRLKTKRSHARAAIVQVLAKQPEQTVIESAARLSQSEDKLIQESAEELKRLTPDYFKSAARPEITVLGREDGFGLYQRYQRHSLPETAFLSVQKKGLFKKRDIVDLRFLNIWPKEKILSYLALWNKRIEAHYQDEYTTSLGTHYLVGDPYLFSLNHSLNSLDALPYGETWRAYFQEDNISPDVVFQLCFVLESVEYQYDKIFKKEVQLVNLAQKELDQFSYSDHICTIISHYLPECMQSHAYLEKAAQVAELFLKYTNDCYIKSFTSRNQPFYTSVGDILPFEQIVLKLSSSSLDDDAFRRYFPLVYRCYLQFNVDCVKIFCGVAVKNKLTLSALSMARACAMGLLPRTALMEMILDSHCAEDIPPHRLEYSNDILFESYRSAYFSGRSLYSKPHLELPEENSEAVCYLRETLDQISDTLIQMETTRLNDVTPVTHYIDRLYIVRGIRYLILALKMLEGEDIRRTFSNNDRQAVFCGIIRRCYPLPEDSALELKAAGIPEKRLVEVAMMAPQWIDYVNEVLNWDGFKEGCYYFIAHMKQCDAKQKKAEIAHYTDLDPADLNDGACDISWCRSVCAQLGEKRIKMLYDASKLMCENNFHIRARKYLDACTGKISREAYHRQAIEKRNKDALNAYCLVPIQDEQDLLERYLYIQQFLKESKTYGAQRQASEKRCCEIALLNLARNAGYDSVDRLIWRMENSVTEQYQDVFEPVLVEDVELCIMVNENGTNQISVTKNGRKLKSIPSRLKNNERVLRIKEANQLLTKQYQRTRSMLEKSMEERTGFDSAEIAVMAKHIIVGPLLRRLVLCCGESFGFYQDGNLIMEGQSVPCTGTVHIAHGVELYQHQRLQEFQKYLFCHKIVQPFKQVFRELYLKLEEELPHEYTERYSGYQIQTRQAAGALKTRGWNVSYESGLEKVCYKQSIVAQLYADADWFSPGDIEAPCIDYVVFSRQKSGKPVLIKDLDDVLFSEVMRDVDLAVSLAFTGGVDPVTSTSTVELRQAIVTCTCQMMKLTNVQVNGNFAHIAGQYNNYSVHLGSGMIHQKAGGAIHMVPVWSGQRGKVYLPFLDEDPMTAQILTKVVMLAKDTSIKDPEILRQIQRK